MSSGSDDGEVELSESDDDVEPSDNTYILEEAESLTRNYKCYTPDMLKLHQDGDIDQISGLFTVARPLARVLLAKYNWDKDKLIQVFLDDPSRPFKVAGLDTTDADATGKPGAVITLGAGDEPARKKQAVEVVTLSCGVCMDELDTSSAYALPCRHNFCAICWQGYLTVKIKEGEATIRCAAFKCQQAVDEATVRKLVEDTVFQRYSRFLLESYVNDNPHIKWCPQPECPNAVWVHLASSQDDVECHCGNAFCFGCGTEAHQPANCDTVAKWRKKCADDSETANWICSNTKNCPKCNKPIEKNGGCNHITCRCGNHFCWVCGICSNTADLIYHHACNAYKGKLEEGENARASLERFLHYFQRFENHDLSKRFEKKFRDGIQVKMRELQELKDATNTSQDAQFILQASKKLQRCRGTLKFSYVFGYYLPDHVERALFEFNQELLERATERLAGLLELPAEELDRQKIIDVASNAMNYNRTLLETIKKTIVEKEDDDAASEESDKGKKGKKGGKKEKAAKAARGMAAKDDKPPAKDKARREAVPTPAPLPPVPQARVVTRGAQVRQGGGRRTTTAVAPRGGRGAGERRRGAKRRRADAEEDAEDAEGEGEEQGEEDERTLPAVVARPAPAPVADAEAEAEAEENDEDDDQREERDFQRALAASRTEAGMDAFDDELQRVLLASMSDR